MPGIDVSSGGSSGPNPADEAVWTLRTGAIAQSLPRSRPTSGFGLTSAALHVTSMYIPAGRLISNISFWNGTTALVGGSNQWFVLADNARQKLAVTADDTATAWAGGAVKTLALTPFTTTYSGLHYVGICVVAGTPISPEVYTSDGNAPSMPSAAPVLAGTSTTGLTNPASCPSTLGALASNTNRFLWCEVS